MSALAAPLISAGSSLLGGLLGKKKGPSISSQMKQARRMEERRYKWLVRGARKAGFNPLTVLRASGGQMAPQMTQATPLSTRAIVGDAMKQFGMTYAQDAIQRASEDRAHEKWKERFDYEQANKMRMSPVSTSPGAPGPQTRLVENSNEIGQRNFQQGSGQFPRVDPHSDRPNDARVSKGPYRDRYVIATSAGYYLTPKGMATSGLTEETVGSVASEIMTLMQLGKDAVEDGGFERVHWNPDTGEVTGAKPKSAAKMRQQSTPDTPLEPRAPWLTGALPFDGKYMPPINTFPRTITDPNYQNLHPRKGTY